jgi:signal transduction histidine kinase
MNSTKHNRRGVMAAMASRIVQIACFLLCSLLCSPGTAAPGDQRSVLLLSTDSLSNPGVFEIFTAFKQTLRVRTQEAVAVRAESLDLTAFDDPAYRERVRHWLTEKYRHARPEVIVVIGNGGLRFLLESGQAIWPGVPIVFTAVSDTMLGAMPMPLPPHVTGLKSSLPLADVVRFTTSLMPGTRKMALVGNASERDNYYQPVRDAELGRLAGSGMDFIDLRGQPVEEIKRRLAGLQGDTVIYYLGLTRDGKDRNLFARETLETLAQAANRPILVHNATYLGAGALGGPVFDMEIQGRDAAVRTIRILSGEAPQALPLATVTTTPVFDWRQLRRWQVAPSNIPPGSDMRFYEPSAWEKYRWQILLTTAVIMLQTGLVVALLLERRRRARAVEESRKRLAIIAHLNRNATATVYSAAIAHELNQPLGAIMSNAEAAELYLGMDPPALDEVREILADIRRDDGRASELIQKMRGLLKKSETQAARVDLNRVAKEVLDFLATEAKMRNVVIAADLAPDALPVLADPVQLQQVLINLILNSMDAMAETPAGNRIVTIRTALAGGHVEAVVEDHGEGFDANIEHVFDSFFTTKPQGMGLGLAITAAIIQAHAGQIWARNSAAGGAIVGFRLPLKPGD